LIPCLELAAGCRDLQPGGRAVDARPFHGKPQARFGILSYLDKHIHPSNLARALLCIAV
jgi:hypothetical protein